MGGCASDTSFFSLAAPANTLVNLLLQLIKATALAMSTDASQVGVALFPSFSHFYLAILIATH